VKKAIGVLFAALLLVGAASGATGKPTLKLVSANDPMIVSGTHFRSKEKVRLTVTVKTPAAVWHRSVVATRAGSFRAVVGLVQTGRCGFNIRAIGSHKSVATLKSPPLPACMP
jgi:phenylacetate-coenzyme A ligase PaaK-like adenylate-forming protein